MALQKTIEQADLDGNPILATLDAVLGDVVSIFHPEDPTEQVIIEDTGDGQ